jgi:formiminotetrahydrofolate cyclodeaminase
MIILISITNKRGAIPINKTTLDYIEEVASSASTPAGGSASAISGALGCALMIKATKLLSKKKLPNKDIKALHTMQSKLEVAKDTFISLARLDSEAFKEVLEAYKATNEDPLLKREAIESALIKATALPVKVMEYVVDVAPLQNKLLLYAPYSFISDVQTATLFLNVAFEGSKKNVFYNMKNIDNDNKVNRMVIQVEESSRQWSYFMRLFAQYELNDK